jgi:hypothetical protein
MELEALPQANAAPKSMKLVLIRANAALFHSVAAAAVLESAAERGFERMLQLFRDDPALCEWLAMEWLPNKRGRARLLREYVEQTWPEFDFDAAMHEYAGAAGAERGLGPRRPSRAHEALARCLSAAQAALFYGVLSRWAEDRRLRALAAAFAQEESLTLARFRALHEASALSERVSTWAAWFAARRIARLGRDVQLPLVFTCLAAHWRPHAPIAEMSYRDFLRRMRGVMRDRGHVGFAERLLLAPWARRPRIRAPQRAGHVATWFKPVLTTA